MTKDEALKKAFKQAFQLGQDYWYQADHEFESQNKKSDVTRAKFEQLMEDAVKEALAQPKQEPVTLSEGKKLILVDSSFDDLMYWLERCESKGHLENCSDLIEPWEKFCDSYCVWTDHHPDCKLAEQEPVATDWERIARVQDAKLRAMCNEAGGFEKLCEVMDKYERTTPPQRKPLTDDEIILIVADCASSHQHTDIHFARAIERAHGIKELV